MCIFAIGNQRAAIVPDRNGARMADQTAAGEIGDRAMVANYVATMSADLATMARRTGLDTLGYLLEMVRLEAESVNGRIERKNSGR